MNLQRELNLIIRPEVVYYLDDIEEHLISLGFLKQCSITDPVDFYLELFDGFYMYVYLDSSIDLVLFKPSREVLVTLSIEINSIWESSFQRALDQLKRSLKAYVTS